MSTEKDVRQVVIIDIADLVGKSITVYDKTTGQAYGLDGQKLLDIASQNISRSQNITTDTGSTEKVPVVAAVELELNKKVSKTGNETVAGIKTFSSSPIVPTPTANTQAANKKYVDSTVFGKQDKLTFGIEDTNAIKVNSENVADGNFAKFTALGLKGITKEQVIEDLSAEITANKNVANGYVGLNENVKVDPIYLPETLLDKIKFLSFTINEKMELIMSMAESIDDFTFEVDENRCLILKIL